MRPTLVVSDLHLGPEKPREGSSAQQSLSALAKLLERFPESDLVLAGDIFDYTLLEASLSAAEAANRFGRAYPELFQALAWRARQGQNVYFVPGNHDATLNESSSQEALRKVFGEAGAHIRFAPWFLRLGRVHIEHGHRFDADNTFMHPLAPHNPETEPLGTALMRRFVAPNNAHIFAHGHSTTLTTGLRTALEHFGPRAPQLIYRYFRTAIGLLREAHELSELRRQEAERGRARLEAYTEQLGLSRECLERLVELGARARHDSVSQTWMRLYFDRVLAALAALGGFGLSFAGFLVPATATTGLGTLYLLASWLHAKERYGRGPGDGMAEGARAIRTVSGAELVLFGHSHETRDEPGYINLGSFTFAERTRRAVMLNTWGKPEILQLPI